MMSKCRDWVLKNWYWVLIAIIIIIMVAVISPLYFRWDFPTSLETKEISPWEQVYNYFEGINPSSTSEAKAINLDKFGQLGDYIGGILNPFVAFLALILLMNTYNLQKKELEEAREELKATRKLIKYQKIESAFFELYKILLSRSENTFFESNFESKLSKFQGYIAFSKMCDEYEASYEKLAKSLENTTKSLEDITDDDLRIRLSKVSKSSDTFIEKQDIDINFTITEVQGSTNISEYRSALFAILSYLEQYSTEDSEHLLTILRKSMLPSHKIYIFYTLLPSAIDRKLGYSVSYEHEKELTHIEEFSLFEHIDDYSKSVSNDLFLKKDYIIEELFGERAFVP